MLRKNLSVKTVMIVGANGTMGRSVAAIFASFGDADVYLISRSKQKSEEAIAKAYLSVRADSIRTKLFALDYSALDDCISKSDLIFETVKEDWEIKRAVHKKISSVLCGLPDHGDDKIICSGTSGLSVTRIAELYPEIYRTHVIGMHFFNPPYYMTLCELIPTKYTDADWFEAIHSYTTDNLLRTSVVVKDSPAFLGNRLGFQFINGALQMAERYKFNGGIDYMDAILGSFTGRAMAPCVTANFVGLDVHKAIVDNLYANTCDFAHDTFQLPEFVDQLVTEGRLGRKTGEGLYKTIVRDDGTKIRQVYDLEHNEYRDVMQYKFSFAETMIAALKVGDYTRAFHELIENKSPEAKICCGFLVKYIFYSLIIAKEVAFKIESADRVMAAGFNWCPPLALMEILGGKEIFVSLCREYLEESAVEDVNFNDLLADFEKSAYDYRRFIYAKR